MAVKSILTTQEDFTGEIPITENTAAMWRFNETAPDSSTRIMDSSGNGRHLTVSGWSGTTASFLNGRHGRYFRMNINNPTTEKTHLIATNDGSFFANLKGKIAVGGWLNPTTYSVGNTFCPIFNTRNGPGQPILYLSLHTNRPRMMLYDSAGTLILDQIDVDNKTSQYVHGDRSDGTFWTAPLRTFTGTLNPNCVANIEIGRHTDTYWYAGGVDDWFFETDSKLTTDDLAQILGSHYLPTAATVRLMWTL